MSLSAMACVLSLAQGRAWRLRPERSSRGGCGRPRGRARCVGERHAVDTPGCSPSGRDEASRGSLAPGHRRQRPVPPRRSSGSGSEPSVKEAAVTKKSRPQGESTRALSSERGQAGGCASCPRDGEFTLGAEGRSARGHGCDDLARGPRSPGPARVPLGTGLNGGGIRSRSPAQHRRLGSASHRQAPDSHSSTCPCRHKGWGPLD